MSDVSPVILEHAVALIALSKLNMLRRNLDPGSIWSGPKPLQQTKENEMKLTLSSLVMVTSLSGLPYIANASALPACSAAALHLAIEAEDAGMSHASAMLTIRNSGDDCMLPSDLPLRFYDSHSKLLPVVAPPTASHKQIRIAGGHRAVLDMRWVSGPVYTPARAAHVASIKMTIGSATLQTPFAATMFGPVNRGVAVSLTRLRSVEGMASDR